MACTYNASEKQNSKNAEKKKKLRAACLKKRNELSFDKRAKLSEKIKKQVFASKNFKTAETVFVYASYKSEVDTKKLIQEALKIGKRVALPKVEGTEMEFYEICSWEELFPGYHGILEPQKKEPVVPKKSDILLLPGAVFDRRGGRIGYGGGYYDRYISKIENTCGFKPYLTALAFPCQMFYGTLPMEEHDKKMDCILTGLSVIMPGEEKYRWLEAVEGIIELIVDIVVEFLD